MYLIADLYDRNDFPPKIKKTDVRAVASHQTKRVNIMRPHSSIENEEINEPTTKNIILTETPFEKCSEKYTHCQFSDNELGEICQKAEEFC